jgi:hypothetical protein
MDLHHRSVANIFLSGYGWIAGHSELAVGVKFEWAMVGSGGDVVGDGSVGPGHVGVLTTVRDISGCKRSVIPDDELGGEGIGGVQR